MNLNTRAAMKMHLIEKKMKRGIIYHTTCWFSVYVYVLKGEMNIGRGNAHLHVQYIHLIKHARP